MRNENETEKKQKAPLAATVMFQGFTSFIHSFIYFILYKKKLTNATYDKIYKVCSRIDTLEHSLKYM